MHSKLTNRLRTCNRSIHNLDKMLSYNTKIYMREPRRPKKSIVKNIELIDRQKN